jgi:glycosyltransferase involved in cell wall biosynthesis
MNATLVRSPSRRPFTHQRVSLVAPAEPLLTVIIPVYNEQGTVDELLRRVVAAPYVEQIVVVDDGSRDGTSDVLARWEDHPGVEILRHNHNRGKGMAIRTGLEQARGRFTIIQDADLEYDPQDYPRLLDPLLRGDAQVVYGSRYLGPQTHSSKGRRLFRSGVSLLNLCVRLLYHVRLTDEATCYKAFPTWALRAMSLECERFEFCPEVTAKACRLRLRIVEVPIRYTPRGIEEGKKIRWTDGLEALAVLWKWRGWRPAPSFCRPG